MLKLTCSDLNLSQYRRRGDGTAWSDKPRSTKNSPWTRSRPATGGLSSSRGTITMTRTGSRRSPTFQPSGEVGRPPGRWLFSGACAVECRCLGCLCMEDTAVCTWQLQARSDASSAVNLSGDATPASTAPNSLHDCRSRHMVTRTGVCPLLCRSSRWYGQLNSGKGRKCLTSAKVIIHHAGPLGHGAGSISEASVS